MTYSDVHKSDVTFVIWVTREEDIRHLLPLGHLLPLCKRKYFFDFYSHCKYFILVRKRMILVTYVLT